MSQAVNEISVLVRGQNGHSSEHVVPKGRSVFIGTSDDCGISIHDTEVAGLHCLLEVSDEGIFLQDWASSSGTHLNGTPIDGRVEIRLSDAITVGNTSITLKGDPQASVQEPTSSLDVESQEEVQDMEPPGASLTEIEPKSSSVPDLGPVEPVVEIESTLTRIQGLIGDHQHEQGVDLGVAVDFETSSTVAVPQDANPFLVETELEVESPITSHFDEEQPDLDHSVENSIATNNGGSENAGADSDQHSLSDDDDIDAVASLHDQDAFDDPWAEIDADDGWGGLEQDGESNENMDFDRETVALLTSELQEMRALLAEREAEIEHFKQLPADGAASDEQEELDSTSGLIERIDQLSQEASEHDSKMSIVVDLLESAELRNQMEQEERQALEVWLSEVEKRLEQKQAEWRCELDHGLKRLRQVIKQRDQAQRQLKQVAGHLDAADAYKTTMEQLQAQNAELQAEVESAHKQTASLKHQLDQAQDHEPEDVQQARAQIAKERADVSRMRYELSQKLAEFEDTPEPMNSSVDTETALRVKTLREHLREIHEQEREERESKGESLISRISNLWKRVEEADAY